MGMNPDLFAEPGYEEFVSAGAGFVGVLVLIYLFVIFLSLALSMAISSVTRGRLLSAYSLPWVVRMMSSRLAEPLGS